MSLDRLQSALPLMQLFSPEASLGQLGALQELQRGQLASQAAPLELEQLGLENELLQARRANELSTLGFSAAHNPVAADLLQLFGMAPPPLGGAQDPHQEAVLNALIQLAQQNGNGIQN